jgi:hypothetical protein
LISIQASFLGKVLSGWNLRLPNAHDKVSTGTLPAPACFCFNDFPQRQIPQHVVASTDMTGHVVLRQPILHGCYLPMQGPETIISGGSDTRE